ncbi:MAG: CDP-diacylglycerol--glycerol-3-phosphate 3-phosphatidyltransferase [Caulobacteraceae bacterium]
MVHGNAPAREAMMKQLPNLLTGLRLALAVLLFLALATAAGAMPWLSDAPTGARFALQRWALGAFVVGAVTDFFDGWLARRWNAVSVWGRILDPIADKALVLAAILGLAAEPQGAGVVVAGGIILFREFAVSALREVVAGQGLTLPVTKLAKWKTALQLTALTFELVVTAWAALGLPPDPASQATATLAANALLWLAAAVTLITGGDYLAQAARALRGRG